MFPIGPARHGTYEGKQGGWSVVRPPPEPSGDTRRGEEPNYRRGSEKVGPRVVFHPNPEPSVGKNLGRGVSGDERELWEQTNEVGRGWNGQGSGGAGWLLNYKSRSKRASLRTW